MMPNGVQFCVCSNCLLGGASAPITRSNATGIGRLVIIEDFVGHPTPKGLPDVLKNILKNRM